MNAGTRQYVLSSFSYGSAVPGGLQLPNEQGQQREASAVFMSLFTAEARASQCWKRVYLFINFYKKRVSFTDTFAILSFPSSFPVSLVVPCSVCSPPVSPDVAFHSVSAFSAAQTASLCLFLLGAAL